MFNNSSNKSGFGKRNDTTTGKSTGFRTSFNFGSENNTNKSASFLNNSFGNKSNTNSDFKFGQAPSFGSVSKFGDTNNNNMNNRFEISLFGKKDNGNSGFGNSLFGNQSLNATTNNSTLFKTQNPGTNNDNTSIYGNLQSNNLGSNQTSNFGNKPSSLFGNTQTNTSGNLQSNTFGNNLNNSYGNNQNSFGNNQGTFGNNQGTFGNNQSTFGNNQSTFGNNQSTFGNNQNTFGNNQSTFGSNQATFGNNQSTFANNQNTFGNNQNTFGNNQNTFGNNQSTFGNNQSTFGNNQSTFGNNQNTFGNNQSTFGNNQGTLGNNQGTFGNNQATFGNNQATFGNNQSTFGNNQSTFGSNQSTFGNAAAASDGNKLGKSGLFGDSSSNSKFGSNLNNGFGSNQAMGNNQNFGGTNNQLFGNNMGNSNVGFRAGGGIQNNNSNLTFGATNVENKIQNTIGAKSMDSTKKRKPFVLGAKVALNMELGDVANANNDFEFPQPPLDSIQDMVFSPVENHIVASAWDSTVSVYQVDATSQNVKPVVRKKVPGCVLKCCWHDDGSKIYLASTSGEVAVWDLGSDQMSVVAKHEKPVSSVCWAKSDTSSFLVSGSWDQKIQYFDLRKKDPVNRFSLPSKVYSMDSMKPYTVVVTSSKTIYIYKMARGRLEELKKFDSNIRVGNRCVTCFQDKPGGPCTGFVTGTLASRITINHLFQMPHSRYTQTTKQDSSFRVNSDKGDKDYMLYPINSISFHPEHTNKLVCGGSDGILYFYSLSDKKRICHLNQSSMPITATTINYDGSLLAYSASYDWSRGYEFYDRANMLPAIYLRKTSEFYGESKRPVNSGFLSTGGF